MKSILFDKMLLMKCKNYIKMQLIKCSNPLDVNWQHCLKLKHLLFI